MAVVHLQPPEALLMSDLLYFRHYSEPITSIPTHEFFQQYRAGVTSIVVMDVNEKEYWEGIQLITGQQYKVFLKDDLHWDRVGRNTHRKLILAGIYYTYDPLDRSGH